MFIIFVFDPNIKQKKEVFLNKKNVHNFYFRSKRSTRKKKFSFINDSLRRAVVYVHNFIFIGDFFCTVSSADLFCPDLVVVLEV
jgi:hypothetical protein